MEFGTSKLVFIVGTILILCNTLIQSMRIIFCHSNVSCIFFISRTCCMILVCGCNENITFIIGMQFHFHIWQIIEEAYQYVLKEKKNPIEDNETIPKARAVSHSEEDKQQMEEAEEASIKCKYTRR